MTTTEDNLHLIRGAAVRCSHVGPSAKAIELFRNLAHATNDAGDYFQLSEALTKGNFLEESISSLEKAMALDPTSFDTQANRVTLEIARSHSSSTTSKPANNKRKIGQ